MKTIKSQIELAITSKSMITFVYTGKTRFVIPLLFSKTADNTGENILCREVNTDAEKLFTLDKITNLHLMALPSPKYTIRETYKWYDEHVSDDNLAAFIGKYSWEHEQSRSYMDIVVTKSFDEFLIAQIKRNVTLVTT